MGLHKITTTMRPGDVILVDDAEYTDLTRQGVVATDEGEVEDNAEDGMLKEVQDSKEAAGMQTSEGTGVPMEGVEHPADGTMSPPVSNDPAPSGKAAKSNATPAGSGA